MCATVPIPSAQYLRRSTEHQQYSLDNQQSTIAPYADGHGFSVVQTYTDARTGVVLGRRSGLRQLLQDVMSGYTTYRVILVYDVSRWGRFQDNDEGAHYEFVCRSVGIPVHYCAESFTNDSSTSTSIMKALKRSMAGEYSRELGVKVLAGQRRLAELGFKQGGMPGYGLRRLLVSANREPKQQLEFGERKSIATDRVILVPGPSNEVAQVREMYRLVTVEGRAVHWVARELNRKNIPYLNGSTWDYLAVYTILTHPKYMGCHVYGRTASRLSTPKVNKPTSEWVVTPGSYDAIVDPAIFAEAQRCLFERTINKSDAAILENLRSLLEREGRLSLHLIQASELPSPSTYRKRFGSLRRAYELIGYGAAEYFAPCDLRRRIQAQREDLMLQLVGLYPHQLTVVRRGGRWRTRLRLSNKRYISVVFSRTTRPWKDTIRWQVDPVSHERRFVTLLVLLDSRNESIQHFYVIPSINRRGRFTLKFNDPWLDRGELIASLASFCDAVRRVCAGSKCSSKA
jgi:DNA invertase Pin-like site-specific DNA recombinase